MTGDFHFLWECLRVLFDMFWGDLSSVGSLCNLREYIRRTRFDKSVKCFNIGDEFVMHVFKAHFIAKICTFFKIQAANDVIKHSISAEWLAKTAEKITGEVLCPSAEKEDVNSLTSQMVQSLYMYVDLHNAIRYENGEHIIRHWRYWVLSNWEKELCC